MKQRFRLLACLLLYCCVFTLFVHGDEAPQMTVSEAGIGFIKEMEGFSPYRVWDYSQYSIGYGTGCGAGDYPNGITREQADALLRRKLTTFDDRLNEFILKYNLPLAQNQYDALVSFSYNLGTSWLRGCRLATLLTEGRFTEAEFASAMGVWCHTGSSVNTVLLRRRIREIQMFLYGDYAGTGSKAYKYLLFEAPGGSADTDVGLYPVGSPYGTLPSAKRQNRIFAGWMTTEGAPVTAETVVSENLKVSARWTTANPVSRVFTDVPEGSWFYSYVDELYADGVLGGYSDKTFRPDGVVTVGEALKLILLACGDSAQGASGGHWAGGYRDLALDKKLVVAGELSDLDAPISRTMIAKIAALRLGLTADSGAGVFADTNDRHAAGLYRAGIVGGTVGTDGRRYFFPNQSISRAEISAIVYRILTR